MLNIRQVATRNVICGENVVIYEPANLYDCTLGDNVFIFGVFELLVWMKKFKAQVKK